MKSKKPFAVAGLLPLVLTGLWIFTTRVSAAAADHNNLQKGEFIHE